ncbi:MAG: hypothetical protein U9N30_01915 [Campylobacterota bacterium]|nr:hypothetical protein [Campylobacterota bacterium]
MKKTLSIGLLSIVLFAGCSTKQIETNSNEAWENTKHGVNKAYDATADTSADAWDSTKEWFGDVWYEIKRPFSDD